MTFGARDFARELRVGAWDTADGDSIFEPSLEDHERQDAAFDVEAGHAAFMLECRHAVPRWSSERLRVKGPWFCGICQSWEKKL